MNIADLPEEPKKDYEKHYSFSDLTVELSAYNNIRNKNTYGFQDYSIIFLAEKIVEQQNRIIELEKHYEKTN